MSSFEKSVGNAKRAGAMGLTLPAGGATAFVSPRDQRGSAISLFVFLLLCAAAFKNDAAGGANSEFWTDLAVPGYVSSIKRLYFLYFLMSFAIGGYVFLQYPNIERGITVPVRFAVLVSYACILSFVSAALISPEGYADFTLMLALLGVELLVYAALNSSVGRIGRLETLNAVHKGLVRFALLFIAINLAIYGQGYGYASGVNRFFGSTTHPNFIGMQMAAYDILLLPLATGSRMFWRIVGIVALAAGLWMQYLSGSRNSLMSFAVGASIYFWFVTRSRTSRQLLLGIGAAVFLTGGILAFGLGLPLDGLAESPLSRGGNVFQDTRADILQVFFDAIAENPLFGVGDVPGATANSYLRGWATYGIFYLILQLGCLVSLLAGLRRLAACSGTAAAMLALCCTLAFGAISEGYLLDNFSPTILLIIISANFAVGRSIRPHGF